jgi:NhaA family Na+:H+ antiporter
MPEARIDRWLLPFSQFLRIQSASGVLLLACTVVAVLLANSAWSVPFAEIWRTQLHIGVGEFELSMSLRQGINDGLMTVFFFVIGLEIKRESLTTDQRDIVLPIIAALGGMIAPAVIYLWFQMGQPGQAGWGIPVATDIAFVAGFLALLDSRVPASLKILLLSLAIVDDIGAILLVAFFYSTDISYSALSIAAAGFGITYICGQIGVRQVKIYVLVGAGIWLAFLKSGVHPTVAGVLLGFLTPSTAWLGNAQFPNVLTKILRRVVKQSNESTQKDRHQALNLVAMTAQEGSSPLERLEFGLHAWVAFLIVPIFALANAGVEIDLAKLHSQISLAVAFGLVLGKPIGIVLFSWIATLLGIARLPAGVSWTTMLGVGCLAGIGFTMSIFIAGVALQGALLDDGKIGALLGSTISAILGCSILFLSMPKIKQVAFDGQKQQAEDTKSSGVFLKNSREKELREDRWRDDGGQGGFGTE